MFCYLIYLYLLTSPCIKTCLSWGVISYSTIGFPFYTVGKEKMIREAAIDTSNGYIIYLSPYRYWHSWFQPNGLWIFLPIIIEQQMHLNERINIRILFIIPMKETKWGYIREEILYCNPLFHVLTRPNVPYNAIIWRREEITLLHFSSLITGCIGGVSNAMPYLGSFGGANVGPLTTTPIHTPTKKHKRNGTSETA